jgi:hypothetical protein
MPMMPATGAALGTNRAERDRVAVNLAQHTIVVRWHPTPDHTGEAWTQPIDL